MPVPTEQADAAIALIEALTSQKELPDLFGDTELWEQMRQIMMETVEPLFVEAFMVGAEVAAGEAPSLSRDYTADQLMYALTTEKALPFDRTRVDRVAQSVIAGYSDQWWAQFSRSTQNTLRRALRQSQIDGTGTPGVVKAIAPLFDKKRARLIAISEATNLMGMGAQETYRESGYTEWEWRTANDGRVDPVCQSRAGQVFPMSVRFERAHPGCRCWPVPAGKPAGFGEINSTTTSLHTTASGRWTSLRSRLHADITTDLMRGTSSVDEPTVYMMGGGPASGKSTILDTGALRLPQNLVRVDPDAIKARIPEYQQMLSAGDARAAAFAHQESSYVSQRVMSEAVSRKRNVLLDGTGDGGIDKLASRIESYRYNGHRVVGEYVTMDIDRALEIQRLRAASTGRAVPEEYLIQTHRALSETVPEALKRGLFDEFRLWDTNIRNQPRLVAEYLDGELVIRDEALWARFLAKATP